jgi:hypothetical protein
VNIHSYDLPCLCSVLRLVLYNSNLAISAIRFRVALLLVNKYTDLSNLILPIVDQMIFDLGTIITVIRKFCSTWLNYNVRLSVCVQMI